MTLHYIIGLYCTEVNLTATVLVGFLARGGAIFSLSLLTFTIIPDKDHYHVPFECTN